MKARPGNDLDLGILTGSGKPLRFPASSRDKHLYVCGGTGTGKSKFLEHLIRQDIVASRDSKCGMLVIDPHGSLYDSVMRWLAWGRLDLPIVPIDLRKDDWVVAYNVLRRRRDADSSVVMTNFVQAMAHVWGEANTKNTPLFALWAGLIMRALYAKELTLIDAEHLINFTSKVARRTITADLPQRGDAAQWAWANSLPPKDFEAKVSSTVNRLQTFLSTQLLRQMFGQSGPSLDLGRALEEGQIILVSLATEKARVSDEDASLFATLLLSDLWIAAKERGKGMESGDVKPFYVYIDEFQNFVTPTIAKGLDQARGFGLHLTLANQFPRQTLHAGAHGRQVFDSVLANARSKVVFATEGEENLRPLALSLFMQSIDLDEVKHEEFGTKVVGFREETRTSESESQSFGTSQGTQSGHATGSGLGGTESFAGHDEGMADALGRSLSASDFASNSESASEGSSESHGHSVSKFPVFVPVFGKERSSTQFRGVEEQVFRAMQAIAGLPDRHALVRIVGTKTPETIRTAEVGTALGSEDKTRRYLASRYAKLEFAIEGDKARQRLLAREQEPHGLLALASGEPASAKRKIK